MNVFTNVLVFMAMVEIGFSYATNESDFSLLTNDTCEPIKLFTNKEQFQAHSYLYEKAKKDSLVLKKQLKGTSYTVTLSSGLKLPLTYFDRNSTTVVILGQGFLEKKERWKAIVPLLSDYDVVAFDYRWLQARPWWYINHPGERFILDEKDDVIQVVNFVKKLKTYSKVIGLAECYSCFTFAAAQADQEVKGHQLFDRLIFDCAFVSLDCVCQNMLKAHGGNNKREQRWLKLFLRNTIVTWPMIEAIRFVIPRIALKDHIQHIKQVPILFIHGKNDHLVPFKKLIKECWSVTQTKKFLLITPFWHISNFTDWGVYKWACDAFIQSSNADDFIKNVQRGIY